MNVESNNPGSEAVLVSPPGMDPVVGAAYRVMSALDAETDGLDRLLLRCRAMMLLASAGELMHLQRASEDLDAAAGALEAVSQRRHDAVTEACELWGTNVTVAADLIAAAPEGFAEEFSKRLEIQRGLLAEAGEAVEVANEVSRHSLQVLSRRRGELESLPTKPLTYGSPNQSPPVVVHELV